MYVLYAGNLHPVSTVLKPSPSLSKGVSEFFHFRSPSSHNLALAWLPLGVAPQVGLRGGTIGPPHWAFNSDPGARLPRLGDQSPLVQLGFFYFMLFIIITTLIYKYLLYTMILTPQLV